ncbi:MAG: hypothetical protein CMO35_03215 [Verrucomicrobiaceae bacterium]|nr:hypothetical protein [Verrucomicrobiaceae bacterium]
MDMELRYADVSEMYRTLERHSVAIDAQELSLAHSLAEKWRDLYVFARTKDLRLAKVKEDFRAVRLSVRNELELDVVAAMASSRCHFASTASESPVEPSTPSTRREFRLATVSVPHRSPRSSPKPSRTS